jgi:hypothetical protein
VETQRLLLVAAAEPAGDLPWCWPAASSSASPVPRYAEEIASEAALVALRHACDSLSAVRTTVAKPAIESGETSPLTAIDAAQLAAWYARYAVDRLGDDSRECHPEVRSHLAAAYAQHEAAVRLIGQPSGGSASPSSQASC